MAPVRGLPPVLCVSQHSRLVQEVVEHHSNTRGHNQMRAQGYVTIFACLVNLACTAISTRSAECAVDSHKFGGAYAEG